MKKAIFNVLGAALVAGIAYEIGAAEGKNVKEKAIAFGLNAYAKGKELVGKILPKEEATVEEPAAPSEEV
jgi:hypothetical protein